MVPAAAAGTAATASMDRASAVETRALFTGFLLFVGSDRPLRERMPSMLDWRRFLPFFAQFPFAARSRFEPSAVSRFGGDPRRSSSFAAVGSLRSLYSRATYVH